MDVTCLQNFLIVEKLLAADSNTGFFGSMTETAVKQWQAKHNIASSGTPSTTGYGAVGPRTRTAIVQALRATGATLTQNTIPSTSNVTSTPSPATNTYAPTPIAQSTAPAIPRTVTVTSVSTSSQTQSNQVATSGASWNTPLTDFLLQDVCVNNQDQPIQGDPVTCAKHRDLRFGEKLPYVRTEEPLGQARFQLSAFPIQAPDGSARIFTPFDWGGVASSHSFLDFDATGGSDGGNIFEANGEYASIVWTRDTSGTSFFSNSNCAYDDTWGLFPMNLAPGQSGSRTFNFSISAGMQCAGNPWTSYTEWSHIGKFTYSSGKTLDTIMVTHYEGTKENFGNIEVLYFTREYGWTRWESWQDTGGNPTCSGPQEKIFHGKKKVMWGCHDDTHLTQLAVPRNPLVNPAGDSLNFSRNLLAAGDFAQGYSVMKAFDGANGEPTSYAISRDSSLGLGDNPHLGVACWNGCGGYNSVYQDIDVALSNTVTLRFGGLMKAPVSSNAALAIFLFSADGNVIGTSKAEVTANGSWQHVDGVLNWDFTGQPVSKIRYQWYISTGGAHYLFDDMYLTPSR
jgi:hypothetical protein